MSSIIPPTILIDEEEDEDEELISEHDDLNKKKPFRPNQKAKVWLKTGFKSLARKCRIVDDNDDGKVSTLLPLI